MCWLGYLNIACVTLSSHTQLKGSIKLGMGVFFSEDSQVEMFSHLSFREVNTFRHSFEESLQGAENSFCVLFRVTN